jgi:transposase-like protein
MPDTLPGRRDVMEEGNQPGRRRNRYPLEYRRDVACLVLDQGRSIADVAREMELVSQTVGNWVRAEKIERGEREGLSRDEREELVRLRREVKRLTTERDLLKRATAFWVKESDR